MANTHPDAYPNLIGKTNASSNEFSIREFLQKYLYLFPWLLVSAGIALSISYTRLRYINPVYSASGKVLIKTDRPGGSVAGDKLGDVLTTSVNTKLMDDQIELIRSTALARLVSRSADLQHAYYYKGNLRNRLIHNPASPIRLAIVALKDSSVGFSMEVQVIDNRSFTINGNNSPILFGANFVNAQGTFRLEKQTSEFGSNKEFICVWTPELDLARGLASGIQVGVATKGGNVLNFVFHSEHPKVAQDVVNGFLSAYQEYSLKDKREGAVSALDFIDGQLSSAKNDLSDIELRLQGFREANKVVALSEQASGYFGNLQESGKQIEDQAIKIKMVDFMINYVKDQKNNGKSIPLIAGISEGAVATLVAEYNKIQLQKEISLQTIPKENPIIRDYDLSLSKIRNEILLSLTQIREGYVSIQRSLEQAELQANTELRNMPGKERELLDITRQQKVMEELYATLLQKKVQTSISTASTLSNIQVLEPGYSNGMPVSPHPRSFYMTALLIGLAIPIGFALLLEFFNDKVRTKRDIEVATAAPMLGEIGHSDAKDTLIVSTRDRKFTAEQFRIIRTNLQYVLKETNKSNIILVTSSMSGEGKSFIATNMAAVMAISGKKTLLVEFDIRKPKLMSGLGLNVHEKTGLTHYLIGKSSVDEIIQPVRGIENLYIIPCGPVPPNPAELILTDRLKMMFDQLKQQFDVIIVDSAPVGMVSDGYVLANYADATLFVVRHNYTFKKQLALVDTIYTEKKLPQMSLVINDVKAQLGYGSYQGYVNYGYAGYGYGYRNDLEQYFETDKPRRFRWLSRLFGK
jgi:capsular exopolysaccharide synthesis family protein